MLRIHLVNDYNSLPLIWIDMQINVCNLSLASTTYFTKKVKALTCHDVEAKIQSLSSSTVFILRGLIRIKAPVCTGE